MQSLTNRIGQTKIYRVLANKVEYLPLFATDPQPVVGFALDMQLQHPLLSLCSAFGGRLDGGVEPERLVDV